MKRFIFLSLLLCVVMMPAFSKETKALPSEAWGLKLGETKIDEVRSTLTAYGLQITNVRSNSFQAEGEVRLNGKDYITVLCVFSDDVLVQMSLYGILDSRKELIDLFSEQFAPLQHLSDNETEAWKHYMGLKDYEMISNDGQGREFTSCLFSSKNNSMFVLTHTLNKSVDELMSRGSIYSAGTDDATKFLGISVDGTYDEVKEKLIDKGFTPSIESGSEVFRGEFNGEKVIVSIATYRNNVYRIAVMDEKPMDAGKTTNRYNTLLQQFIHNHKYYYISGNEIPENEFLEYEMTTQNRQYRSVFIQQNDYFNTEFQEIVRSAYSDACKKFSAEDMLQNYDSVVSPYIVEKVKKTINERTWNTSVWFTISRIAYGEYVLILYYDNPRNKSYGEDL